MKQKFSCAFCVSTGSVAQKRTTLGADQNDDIEKDRDKERKKTTHAYTHQNGNNWMKSVCVRSFACPRIPFTAFLPGKRQNHTPGLSKRCVWPTKRTKVNPKLRTTKRRWRWGSWPLIGPEDIIFLDIKKKKRCNQLQKRIFPEWPARTRTHSCFIQRQSDSSWRGRQRRQIRTDRVEWLKCRSCNIIKMKTEAAKMEQIVGKQVGDEDGRGDKPPPSQFVLKINETIEKMITPVATVEQEWGHKAEKDEEEPSSGMGPLNKIKNEKPKCGRRVGGREGGSQPECRNRIKMRINQMHNRKKKSIWDLISIWTWWENAHTHPLKETKMEIGPKKPNSWKTSE